MRGTVSQVERGRCRVRDPPCQGRPDDIPDPLLGRTHQALALLLDYSLAPNGSYRSDDPNLLAERLVRETQIHARSVTQRTPLRDALRASAELVTEIMAGLRASEFVASLYNMAAGVASSTGGTSGERPQLAWEDPRLAFVVREPFVSRQSGASIVAGMLEPGTELELESRMPADGVIFSDGVETDRLAFESGAVAHVRAASQRARLVVG